MAEFFNTQSTLGPISRSLDANQYELLRAQVSQRVTDPALVDEYLGAYVQVARELNMSITEFVELLNNQGSDYDQDVFLAGYLNRNRVANARLGVLITLTAPASIAREIRA